MVDIGAYLADVDPRLLDSREGRIALTALNPLLFGLLYFPHHLRSDETDDQITLSEFHVDLVEHAKHWAIPPSKPREARDAYVASRNSGKTTWGFLILPAWAAAHGHVKFCAAFSDSATQAETHLATFRHELDTNALLRQDFPELCRPARKARGPAESDNVSMYIAASRFVFAARGMDTKSLGLKVGDQRPGLIVLDDVEPGEENYSPAMKEKRLGALTDSVLPLNEWARVVLIGTVTMPDSIVHDLVRSVTGATSTVVEPWVSDQNFRCHYYPALIVDEQTGKRRSIWPEKWPLSYLESIEHTRDFKKNFQNDPLGRDGAYWTDTDFTYGTLPHVGSQLLSIDPAVTSKSSSDDTALAVIGCQREVVQVIDGRRTVVSPKQCVVLYAEARRVQVGSPLREWVIAVLSEHPYIRGVLIEDNQGKDAWFEILHDLGVPIETVHNHVPKEVRAARLLARYQTGRVKHAKRFPKAEGQMVGFPKSPYDDLVDAIGNGVAKYLGQPKVGETGPGRTLDYA